jgi:hypothetical protein
MCVYVYIPARGGEIHDGFLNLILGAIISGIISYGSNYINTIVQADTQTRKRRSSVPKLPYNIQVSRRLSAICSCSISMQML